MTKDLLGKLPERVRYPHPEWKDNTTKEPVETDYILEITKRNQVWLVKYVPLIPAGRGMERDEQHQMVATAGNIDTAIKGMLDHLLKHGLIEESSDNQD